MLHLGGSDSTHKNRQHWWLGRYVETVSRPCTWGNSLLGIDTLTPGTISASMNWLLAFWDVWHIQHHTWVSFMFRIMYHHSVCMSISHYIFSIENLKTCVFWSLPSLGTNNSPLKNRWFYITPFLLGFGQYFQGANMAVSGGKRWHHWSLQGGVGGCFTVNKSGEDGSSSGRPAPSFWERIHWIHIPPGEKGTWSLIVPS